MSARHTSGPWFVTETAPDRDIDYSGETFVRWHANGMPLVTLGNYAPDERRANARLIAAAPDLLEALEELLNALPSATTHPAIKAARAAIARATGEAQ